MLVAAGAIIGIIAGLCAIIVSIYGGIKWARDQLKSVIVEDVTPMFDKQNATLAEQDISLKHLHDCVEQVGREAIAHAKTAAAAATAAASAATDAATAATKAEAAAIDAHDAAAKADTAVSDHVATMEVHIAEDVAAFDTITEWRDKTDQKLAEIQQAQSGNQ